MAESHINPNRNLGREELLLRIAALEAEVARKDAALRKLSTAEGFTIEALGTNLQASPLGREILARMDAARAALADQPAEGGK